VNAVTWWDAGPQSLASVCAHAAAVDAWPPRARRFGVRARPFSTPHRRAELVLVMPRPYLELTSKTSAVPPRSAQSVTPVCDPRAAAARLAISASRATCRVLSATSSRDAHALQQHISAANQQARRRRICAAGVDAFTACGGLSRSPRAAPRLGGEVRIAAGARVLAPAYLAATKCGASVVTRYSVLEHHAEVDCGTVVEDSTLLPYSYVARARHGHSIVGNRRVYNLRRDAEYKSRSELVDAVRARPHSRAASVVAWLRFLPRQFVRAFPASNGAARSLPVAVSAPCRVEVAAALEAAPNRTIPSSRN